MFRDSFLKTSAITTEGELYLPIRELEVKRRGKKVRERRPVYPGYLFWITEEWQPEHQWAFRQVSGYLRVLGHKGIPAPLSEQDRDVLRTFMQAGSILGRSLVQFDQNQRIIVLKGPLKGLEGRIIKVDKRKNRARVRLDLYNSSFEIDFGFERLEGAAGGKT